MRDAKHLPVWRLVLAAVLVLAPIVGVGCSTWNEFTALVLLGIIGALNAALVDERAIVLTGLVTAVVTFVAMLLAGTGAALPLLGTALIAALSMATAAAASHGLMSVGAVEIILAVHLLVDPSDLDAGLGSSGAAWSRALILAGVVLGACAWVFVIKLAVLPGRRAPTRVEASIPYATLLAVVCGGFTLICLIWFRGTNMWWTVLTVALVLQPAGRSTWKRAENRIIGTFVGATVTAIAAALIPSQTALLILGVAAGIACVVFTVGPFGYWLYATAVTVTVMLLTFTPSELVGGEIERIGCTVLAAATSVGAVLLAERRSEAHYKQPGATTGRARAATTDP